MKFNTIINSIIHSKRNMLILIIAAAIIIALILMIALAGGQTAEESPDVISAMEVSTQDTGGVTTTNYMPILDESVGWESLDDEGRAELARYAVNAAIERAERDGVETFNVMGLLRPDNGLILFYNGEESMYVYLNGEPTSVPLKG